MNVPEPAASRINRAIVEHLDLDVDLVSASGFTITTDDRRGRVVVRWEGVAVLDEAAFERIFNDAVLGG